MVDYLISIYSQNHPELRMDRDLGLLDAKYFSPDVQDSYDTAFRSSPSVGRIIPVMRGSLADPTPVYKGRRHLPK